MKRYAMDYVEGEPAEIPEGRWVLYEDYAAERQRWIDACELFGDVGDEIRCKVLDANEQPREDRPE